MVSLELSGTMAYTTRNTVNRVARKELNLNPVVLELSKEKETYRAAILVFQNNETAAMLVYQTSPVEVELFLM